MPGAIFGLPLHSSHLSFEHCYDILSLRKTWIGRIDWYVEIFTFVWYNTVRKIEIEQLEEIEFGGGYIWRKRVEK